MSKKKERENREEALEQFLEKEPVVLYTIWSQHRKPYGTPFRCFFHP